MIKHPKKIKVGIVGCGAIGSRLALSIDKDFKKICSLKGLYDIDSTKLKKLSTYFY